jgi:hypothetical protein
MHTTLQHLWGSKAHTQTHNYTHIHTRMRTHIQTQTRTNTHRRAHARTHAHAQAQTHSRAHIQTPNHTRAHTRTHTHVHMHAHVVHMMGFANFSALLVTLPHLSSRCYSPDVFLPKILYHARQSCLSFLYRVCGGFPPKNTTGQTEQTCKQAPCMLSKGTCCNTPLHQIGKNQAEIISYQSRCLDLGRSSCVDVDRTKALVGHRYPRCVLSAGNGILYIPRRP